MNIRIMKRVNMYLLSVFLLLSIPTPGVFAQVKTEHPRIWLTDERIALLQDRLNRGTYNANYITNWCASHMADDLSRYVSANGVSVVPALNYAMMYQATGKTFYAQRAVEIIEYIFEHPYTGGDPPRTIDTWITYDNWYTVRYLVPTVALVLDWCYDWMSQDQRDRIVSQLVIWGDMLIDPNNNYWAKYMTSNNYYYGYMWALTTTAYAIYGHSGKDSVYLDYAKMMIAEGVKFARGEEVKWAEFDNTKGRAKGGLWSEGTSYGTMNVRWLYSAIIAIKDAEGIDFPDDSFDYYNESIYAFIHATHPNGTSFYSDGDGAKGAIGDPYRTTQLIMTALAEGDVKGHGQHWLNTITSHMVADTKLYKEFLWYDDTVEAIDYGTDENVSGFWYCDGFETVFWRSGWGEDDTWIQLKSGACNTDHVHNGLGGFQIYKQGFLATDKAIETSDGELHSDIHHNCLVIPPRPGEYFDNKLYWGETIIEHIKSEPEFLYFAADLSGPYLAQGAHRNNEVVHKEREFFLLKDEEVLAIMDRGTSISDTTSKTFQIYLHAQAVPSGNNYVSSNGNAELTIFTAYPPVTVTSLETNGIPLMRVTTAEKEVSKTFLHLLRVSEPYAGFQARRVTVDGDLLAAGAFTSAITGVDYLVAFSNDTEGDTPSVSTLNLTFEYYASEIIGYVANMTPNSEYHVSDSTEGVNLIITISNQPTGNSGLYASDEEGVLYFIRYPEEDPLPTPVPDGVKIKK